ncbi:hypothetical protein E2C01_063316 [Portunus trituberculatus]|uniref:Uncharacterized protein n=1 Tax=Portunus trituberculatus TaxID=210409 RepID=A0A5B7H8V1_PORTR|nr:hypothetical protein [Portunus trituberculatus]
MQVKICRNASLWAPRSPLLCGHRNSEPHPAAKPRGTSGPGVTRVTSEPVTPSAAPQSHTRGVHATSSPTTRPQGFLSHLVQGH